MPEYPSPPTRGMSEMESSPIPLSDSASDTSSTDSTEPDTPDATPLQSDVVAEKAGLALTTPVTPKTLDHLTPVKTNTTLELPPQSLFQQFMEAVTSPSASASSSHQGDRITPLNALFDSVMDQFTSDNSAPAPQPTEEEETKTPIASSKRGEKQPVNSSHVSAASSQSASSNSPHTHIPPSPLIIPQWPNRPMHKVVEDGVFDPSNSGSASPSDLSLSVSLQPSISSTSIATIHLGDPHERSRSSSQSRVSASDSSSTTRTRTHDEQLTERLSAVAKVRDSPQRAPSPALYSKDSTSKRPMKPKRMSLNKDKGTSVKA